MSAMDKKGDKRAEGVLTWEKGYFRFMRASPRVSGMD